MPTLRELLASSERDKVRTDPAATVSATSTVAVAKDAADLACPCAPREKKSKEKRSKKNREGDDDRTAQHAGESNTESGVVNSITRLYD